MISARSRSEISQRRRGQRAYGSFLDGAMLGIQAVSNGTEVVERYTPNWLIVADWPPGTGLSSRSSHGMTRLLGLAELEISAASGRPAGQALG